jgi:alpha-glucosidase
MTQVSPKKTGSLFALLVLQMLLLSIEGRAQSTNPSVKSPDGRIVIQVGTGDRLSYSVSMSGKMLLKDSTLSLKIDQQTLGTQPKILTAKQRTVDQKVEPVVRQKSASIRENYNELRLDMAGNYAVVFRAYNQGVAYRIETSLPQSEVKIYGEGVNINFAGDYSVYYPQEDSFFSHNERKFLYLSLKDIAAGAMASLPAVVDTRDGIKLAIAEADVDDYPGLWLRGNNSNSLSGIFPPYPLKEELNRDRDYKVAQAADYIALTNGTRTFPWRVIGIAEKDGDLIANQLVYLLARPSQVQDTSWIKPGKVAWDWWNANNIDGVDFKSGINTQTYKYYIDFASKYGIEYIILDEGWYKLGHQLEVVPEMNIADLVAYKQKHVGIILWTVWKTLDDEFEQAFAQFENGESKESG